MISASYDRELDIVRTQSDGFTSPEDMEAYSAEMVVLMKGAHDRGVPFLHLVDARTAQPQTKESVEKLQALLARYHQPENRTAVIQGAGIANIQRQRLSNNSQAFGDAAAALDWLFEARSARR